jgi:hypothetical protein
MFGGSQRHIRQQHGIIKKENGAQGAQLRKIMSTKKKQKN